MRSEEKNLRKLWKQKYRNEICLQRVEFFHLRNGIRYTSTELVLRKISALSDNKIIGDKCVYVCMYVWHQSNAITLPRRNFDYSRLDFLSQFKIKEMNPNIFDQECMDSNVKQIIKIWTVEDILNIWYLPYHVIYLIMSKRKKSQIHNNS